MRPILARQYLMIAGWSHANKVPMACWSSARAAVTRSWKAAVLSLPKMSAESETELGGFFDCRGPSDGSGVIPVKSRPELTLGRHDYCRTVQQAASSPLRQPSISQGSSRIDHIIVPIRPP